MSGSVSSTKQRRAVILTAIRAGSQAVPPPSAYRPREVPASPRDCVAQGDFIDSIGHTSHVGIVEIGAGSLLELPSRLSEPSPFSTLMPRCW